MSINKEPTYNKSANEYIAFQDFPDILDMQQLQNALGIGRNTAYKLIKNNEIKHIRIGRAIKIPKRYLLDYIAEPCYNGEIVKGELSVLKEVLQ